MTYLSLTLSLSFTTCIDWEWTHGLVFQKKQKRPCNQYARNPLQRKGSRVAGGCPSHMCAPGFANCGGVCGEGRALLGAVPPNNYCFIYFWFMMRAPTRLLRQGGNIKFVQLYFPTFASHNTAIILELLRLDNDTFGNCLPLSFFYSAIFRERPFICAQLLSIAAYNEETAS